MIMSGNAGVVAVHAIGEGMLGLADGATAAVYSDALKEYIREFALYLDGIATEAEAVVYLACGENSLHGEQAFCLLLQH